MTAPLPTFSIIIPSYNRPAILEECLESLQRLDYPKGSMEVVIVDDGSDVPLSVTPESLDSEFYVTVLRQENAGPAVARNRGAEDARHEYLAFIDDDCRPQNKWLQVMANTLVNHPQAMLGGSIVNALSENCFSEMSQQIVSAVYRHYNRNTKHAQFFASNNMVIQRDAFLDIGGMDPHLRTAEDRELCNRWLSKGNQMIYVEEALVLHAHALGYRSFCKQHFEYGQGAYAYFRIRKKRQSGSILKESGFHLHVKNWLIVPILEGPQYSLSKIPVRLFLVITWQVVNACGFFYAACKKG